METDHSCDYVKNYSEIGTIQKAHKVSYSVDRHMNGTLIKLVHTQNGKSHSVKCLCRSLSVEKAKNILLYFYENSVGIDNFLDILQDHNIKFTELT